MSAETFQARCCGDLTFTDGKALKAHRTAAHKGGEIVGAVRPNGWPSHRLSFGPSFALNQPKQVVFRKPSVTLGKIEREWLGKYVTVWGSPQVWQVWSLSPTGVWLVRNGKTREARIQDLVERATPQGFEDVAFNFEQDDAA